MLLIAHQHVSACTAQYCYGKSIRLSVRHTLIWHQNERTYCQSLYTIW